MVRRSRHVPFSGLALAIYIACTLLVCSFIFFEVLDVDGSNLPARPTAAATPANLSEASHDIRRALLKAPTPFWLDVALVYAGRSVEVVRLHCPGVRTPSPPRTPSPHGARVTLPRGCLPDSPIAS